MSRRVALITGATGGLGRSIAGHLAEAGYALALLARDRQRLHDLASELRERTPVWIESGDVRRPATMPTVVGSCLQQWGRLDLLVTAHGAAPMRTPSLEVTAAQWAEVCETDVLGTLRACQAAAKAMIGRGGGAMVLLSSLHAFQTYPARAPYAAAKAG